MKRKVILLLFVLSFVSSNVFAELKTANIKDMGVYVEKLMEMTSDGDNNAWLILDGLATHMNENSVIFTTIRKAAEKDDDRAKYLLGKFYMSRGKYEEAIKWLGKVTNDRYRNARFMLAVALMYKAKRTSDELYFVGAAEILNKLKRINVSELASIDSINFLMKACEKGTPERKIFMQSDSAK